MIVVRTFAEARQARSGSVALVPTMGYFHEGHISLIEHAATQADTTVVSLFVNPTQFGEPDDLDTYPMDEARDTELARKAGADVLFIPSVDEVYPGDRSVSVTAGTAGEAMEGAYRPGHFDGVATVVAKLFAGIKPDSAWFGRKDAQQLAVVRSMTDALRLPVHVGGLPIIRESDGLALSSRNTRLSPEERSRAAAISRALFDAADVVEGGERRSEAIASRAMDSLKEADVEVEYVAVADRERAHLVDEIESDVFVAAAVRVGDVRLIDNVGVDAGTLTVDRGVRLTEPSILYSEV